MKLSDASRARRAGALQIFAAILVCGAVNGHAQLEEIERGHFTHEGRLLSFFCAGAGNPTLILEAPSGMSNEEAFRNVLPALAAQTRICAYERAGFGSSEPLPQGLTQTTSDYARELRSFVRSKGQAAPFVIVGFSYGGFVARYFAAAHPEAVAGLVLIDSPHEQWLRTMKTLMSDTDWSRVEEILRWFMENLGHDVWASQFEVEASPPLREKLPIVIVTRGQDHERMRLSGVSEAGFRIYNDVHFQLAPDLERLSDNTIHVRAPCSDHMIPDRAPDVVVAAIEAMVETVRSGLPLRAPAGRAQCPAGAQKECPAPGDHARPQPGSDRRDQARVHGTVTPSQVPNRKPTMLAHLHMLLHDAVYIF